jgi:hydroxyacylglutathione hydrolase
MLVKQFVDEGLGNTSYLIGSVETGLAAVLDPERDVDRVLQTAEGLGLRILYTLDTHLHNDFVSGTREIVARTGATAGASAGAGVGFEHLPLHDGSVLELGGMRIVTLATPGHTPEHISFAVYEPGRPAPTAVFSGGALIAGGAARTDLLGHDLAIPLARQLYHSIQEKLLGYPDEVTVYPTHGAGSFCSAPASAERVTTIGREKLGNPLAQAEDEEHFVAQALSGLPSYPTYFRFLRAVNQRGPAVLGGLPVLKPLNPEEVLQHSSHGVAVLDTRPAEAFAAGHIPGSYSIPLSAPLITWAGWVIPFESPIILIGSDVEEREMAVRQLIRIGYDDLRGYLAGGFDAWEADSRPVARVSSMPAQELAGRLEKGKPPAILDVRSAAEWRSGRLPHALHIEAGRLPTEELPFSKDEQIVVHCGHADRSMVGISVLERRGYQNLVLLEGGVSGWQAAGYPVVSEP